MAEAERPVTPTMDRLTAATRAVLLCAKKSRRGPDAHKIVRVILTELADADDASLIAGTKALPSRVLDADDVAAVMRASLAHVMGE